MKINVFKKERISKEGKKFNSYFGRLTNKSGFTENVSVKFRDIVDLPERFPVCAVFDKSEANLSEQIGDNDEIYKTLWITSCNFEPYEDHSLDEYED